MKIGAIVKDSLILAVITLVLSFLLSGVKVITQKSIDKAEYEARVAAYNKVVPGFVSFDNVSDMDIEINSKARAGFLESDEKMLICKNGESEIVGYIIQSTSRGYGGPLNLIVGFNNEGVISGVAYANIPQETPGLGMKTTEETFLNSWAGHNYENVNQVDAISGATLSSEGFRQAVTFACDVVNTLIELNKGGLGE